MKVAIDPGHGGSDPGAIGGAGTREADISLAISIKLKNLLTTSGCSVIMTREIDSDCAGSGVSVSQELQARCDIANNNEVDLFISIHCNAAENIEAHGTETWYYDAGRDMAEVVQLELAGMGLADRGIKQGDFYVIKYTNMPAILVEVGFISNVHEEALLCDGEFQWGVAKALARGILTRMRGDDVVSSRGFGGTIIVRNGKEASPRTTNLGVCIDYICFSFGLFCQNVLRRFYHCNDAAKAS